MPEEQETKKLVKKETKEAKLVEIATQTGMVIELEDGERVDDLTILVRIYNKLLKIEKSVA